MNKYMEPTITMSLKEYESLKSQAWLEIEKFKSSFMDEKVREGIEKENIKAREALINMFKGLSLFQRIWIAIKNK